MKKATQRNMTELERVVVFSCCGRMAAATDWPLLDDGGPARVEFDDGTGATFQPLTGLPVDIYVPARAPLSTLVHEIGHAAHLLVVPESRGWPATRCEEFANICVILGQRQDLLPVSIDEALWPRAAEALGGRRGPEEAFDYFCGKWGRG